YEGGAASYQHQFTFQLFSPALVNAYLMRRQQLNFSPINIERRRNFCSRRIIKFELLLAANSGGGPL
ncbi:MAG: hypothetical protein QXJ76_08280, partial [Candidatus Bathyarchaeia archaeon]